MKRSIRQIIPATGWWAIYKERDGTTCKEPLVAWALVTTTYDAGEEHKGARASEYEDVIGLAVCDEEVGLCEAPNLCGYSHDSDAE